MIHRVKGIGCAAEVGIGGLTLLDHNTNRRSVGAGLFRPHNLDGEAVKIREPRNLHEFAHHGPSIGITD